MLQAHKAPSRMFIPNSNCTKNIRALKSRNTAPREMLHAGLRTYHINTNNHKHIANTYNHDSISDVNTNQTRRHAQHDARIDAFTRYDMQ